MTGSFILDYCLLVFLAASGVFQIVAAWKSLWGLLLLGNRPASLLLGMALVVGAFTWFYLSEDRNVPDTAGGLDGNQQFAFFFAGLGSSLAFILLLSSLVNRRLGATDSPPESGLDALKQSNYLRALYHTWRQVRPKNPSPASNCPSVERPNTGP